MTSNECGKVALSERWEKGGRGDGEESINVHIQDVFLFYYCLGSYSEGLYKPIRHSSHAGDSKERCPREFSICMVCVTI